MAIQRVVSITINLKGDGSSTSFVFSLSNSFGVSIFPSSVLADNPPIAVNSSTVDASGNVTLTLASAIANGTILPFVLNLIYNSSIGLSSSSIPTLGVVFPASQPVVITAGSAVIGHVVVDSAPSTAVTNAGTFAVQATLSAETTKVVGTARVLGNAGATLDAAVGTMPTNNQAAINVPSTDANAACSIKNAAALTVVNVKASAGNVYGITVVNKTASVIYLQFYNTAGTPTLGTSVVWWIPIAASATLVIAPNALALGNFATGIGIGASTTPTSTGTPATAPDVSVWYK